jgi:hypothetical protein
MIPKSASLTVVVLALSSSLALASASDMIRTGEEPTVDVSTGTLIVKSVNSPEDGFLVVHVMTDGKPVKVIGHAEVKKGENTGIPIILDTTPKAGDELGLMLHSDTGAKGKYEFGIDGSSEDAPMTADGEVVISKVSVE